MTLRNREILISGGGIAGPALAYWLHRFGFTPTIVERAPEIRTGGQRIEMSGIGLEAFDYLGITQQVRAAGGPAPSVKLYTGPGNRPTDITFLQSDPTAGSGPAAPGDEVAIKRGPLSGILYQQVKGEVEYIFDDSIEAVRQSADGVDVTFENAAPRRFDLVIGADGLHSNVRSLVFGDSGRFAHFLGTNLVIFTVDNYLGLRDSGLWHVWPYRGCAITTFPGNTELEGMFLIRSTRPLDVRSLSREERMRFVDRIFREDGWEVPGLLRAMRDSRDFHFSPSTQIRMDSLCRGRVALVGDAGYCPDPMAGYGSSLGLAGAHILAGELREADGDHTAAFGAYEEKMRGIVPGGQEIANFSTSFFAPRSGRAGVWVREQAIRSMEAYSRISARLGLRRGQWDPVEGHTLPDYESPAYHGRPARGEGE
ncbi:2-polyprenyl-6-methoxyphenol hydroxylase-like FAD-dependent oxidoreductase [Nocardiopsis mwathae]|uniref:2-polyprenyl-6-methoxyphenol hydroxylase-like FAD-dependent oxidoreductase n=1 Tax=Nocardiopsis mwathae TaxID=1472723 RepID=A0A7W9YGI4_9ACTN|nr:FAD-dependent monooxygenase [Nocardiopsis mwathae]MBB6171525.1 2-polyprenyl-6-methoxyphenol hydroxylase-like FAD-dependent oxidoreductase [Nocardiopsis mwathae]